ncbi:hypothetical protein [Paenibacillus sp.]
MTRATSHPSHNQAPLWIAQGLANTHVKEPSGLDGSFKLAHFIY